MGNVQAITSEACRTVLRMNELVKTMGGRRRLPYFYKRGAYTMPKIKRVGTAASFFCPGCRVSHSFVASEAYNMDDNLPTMTSWLTYANGGGQVTCKAHITEGKIIYTMDSRHSLAGQIIDLPELGTGGLPK